jgi:hypothetical protein
MAVSGSATVEAPSVVEFSGWSASEPAHWCLRDVERTEALLAVIARTVQPNDVVVEAGAGSGVLALAAARAGAKRVYAVEVDASLVGWLRRTVARNGLADRIEVIHGDATAVELPRAVDVVIAELIDTGLLDERQVPVLNALHARGVIGPRTRLIPEGYTSFVDLVEVDDRFYGFRFAAPIHDWRTCRLLGARWHPLWLRSLTERLAVATVDFARPTPPRLRRDAILTPTGSGLANGLRLSGVAHLGAGIDLGATNALNGDKIILFDTPTPVVDGDPIAGRIGGILGGGLESLTWRPVG